MRAALLFFLTALSLRAGVLDPALSTPWVVGQTVGVRGGMDAMRALFTATNWVFTNTLEEVQNTVNNSDPYTVVMLTNGTYIFDTALYISRSQIILRGQSQDGVRIVRTNDNNEIVTVSGSTITTDPYLLHSGGTKGSTSLVLRAALTYARVGDIAFISQTTTNHPTWRVISPSGYDRIVGQDLVIDSISNGTNINFWPPLVTDFTNNPAVHEVGGTGVNGNYVTRHRVGIENLTISQTNSGTGMKGGARDMLTFSSTADCWASGTRVEYIKNNGVLVSYSVSFTFESNVLEFSQSATPGPNCAGLLVGHGTGHLIQNNTFAHNLNPALEFNDRYNGNAIFANYFTNCVATLQCHNSHSMMNLHEANILHGQFRMDGYYGSASHQTLWRNAILSVYSPLEFKRWTTYMQVVGNVLGWNTGTYIAYSHDTNGVGYAVVEFGRPNIGNHSFDGTNPPTAFNYPGNYYYDLTGTIWSTNGAWTLTNNLVAATNVPGNFEYVTAGNGAHYPLLIQSAANTNYYYGSTSGWFYAIAVSSSNMHVSSGLTASSGDRVFIGGPTVFQQLQSQDKLTHVFWDNYDFFTLGIKAGLDTNETVETSILYPEGAPVWWEGRRWPAVQTESATLVTAIPAEDRYYGRIAEGGGGSGTAANSLQGRFTIGGMGRLQ